MTVGAELNRTFSGHAAPRLCPLCDGKAAGTAFPYTFRFNAHDFEHVSCGSCGCVYVDPVPDAETFAKMYAKASYHDAHYIDRKDEGYTQSAKLLRKFLPHGARVLDYGCGLGPFLNALTQEGLEGTGVEFDAEAVRYAAENTGRPVFTTAEFLSDSSMERYDAIYLCDVVAHLPEPVAILRSILRFLRPGGVLFVEGPLPTNPSLVYFAARLFGAMKRRFNPGASVEAPPTHLVLANAAQHRALFARTAPSLTILHWRIYETGWPYAEGGAIKRAIAALASALGGKSIGGIAFGNRFQAIYRLGEADSQ